MPPASVYRRVAMMQIELMTRVFYLLQLQRFANAPRTWLDDAVAVPGADRTRSIPIVDEVRTTLDPKFEKFFRYYLFRQPRFASAHGNLPIQHPWLAPEPSHLSARRSATIVGRSRTGAGRASGPWALYGRRHHGGESARSGLPSRREARVDGYLIEEIARRVSKSSSARHAIPSSVRCNGRPRRHLGRGPATTSRFGFALISATTRTRCSASFVAPAARRRTGSAGVDREALSSCR